MRTVKTKRSYLLIVFTIIMSMLCSVALLGITNTSSIKQVFANESTFSPGDVPMESWADTDFSTKGLYINLEGGNNTKISETSLKGEGTAENPYEISTAEELALLSFVSRRGSYYTQFEDLYFKQTANIDLGGKLWTPIGTNHTARRFKGHYDGGDYEISNMYAYTSEFDYWGLFSYVEGGEFKNIKIIDGYVNNMARNYAGLLSARSLNIKVHEVEVNGLVSGHAVGQASQFIGRGSYKGGLIGFAESDQDFENNTFTNIINNAVVRGVSHVGGMVGYLRNIDLKDIENSASAEVYGDQSNSNVGGIVGTVDGARTITFENLKNHGFVQANNTTVGGLVGSSTNNNARLVILNSENNGTVKSYNESANEYRNIAGGIIGRVNYITMENTVNHGDIEGRNEVGGLIGRSDRDTFIKNSKNFGKITAHPTTSTTHGYHAGGLVGYITNVTHIDNSDNHGEVVGNTLCFGYNGVGGLVGTWTGRASSITNSNNYANVTGSSAGGAIGYISGANIEITDFNNQGTLTTARDKSGSSLRGVGGIIGLMSNAGSTLIIKDSTNIGELYGSYVGGIIGNANAMGIIDLDNVKNNIAIILEEKKLNEKDITPNAVGGLVGYSNARLAINNSVNVQEIASSGNYVGGLVGRMLHATSEINNSHNKSNVTGFTYVGGIVGDGRGTYNNVYTLNDTSVTGYGNYVGGIMGLSFGSTFTNVTNNSAVVGGSVTEDGNDYLEGTYVGGLIGSTNSGSTVLIEQSINNATVQGKMAVGGLIGRSVQTTVIKDNTINNGNVTGAYYYVGGIVGQQSAGNLQISNTNNSADVVSNTHTILAIGNVSYATGGIVGAVTGSNCILKITDVNNSAFDQNNHVKGQFVGGILGYVNIRVVANSTLTNVKNYADITVEYDQALLPANPNFNNYGGYAGGLVGTSASSAGSVAIHNSVNYGNVKGRYVGGLVASMYNVEITNSSTASNVQLIVDYSFDDDYDINNYNYREKGAGGLVYRSYYFARIYNSTNNAKFVFTEADGRISAVAGLLAISRNTIIRGSTNNSNIEISSGDFIGNHSDYIGGLVGYAYNFTTLEISDSYSKGTIDFEYAKATSAHYIYVGGAIGRAVPTIGATANANGTTYIKNVVVSADVIVNSMGRNHIGGLVGDLLYSFNISNVVVKGDVTTLATASNYNYQGGLIGRIHVTYNVLSNLAYEIKNVMFEGNIDITQTSGTSYVGSLVGHMEFHNVNPNANSPQEISININNSYTIANISDNNNSIIGGLIGRLYFANRTIDQFVNINSSYYLGTYDEDQELYLPEIVGFIHTNPVDNAQELNLTNSIAATQQQLETRETFVGWQFGYGDDATFWQIGEYNNGKPYLSNIYPATIIFTTDSVSVEIDSKVGNSFTLTENLVARPNKTYYDFVGWTTNLEDLDENGIGSAQFVYGDLIEVTADSITLYAVWQAERLFIDILGPAELYKDDTVLTDRRITADTDAYLQASMADGDNLEEWLVYNNQTDSFIKLEGALAETLILSSVLSPEFIDAYSYINNGVKTITLQAIVTGTTNPVILTFAEGTSSDWARNIKVKVQDDEESAVVEAENFRLGRAIDVKDNATVYVTFSANDHYVFSGFIIKDTNGAIIEDEVLIGEIYKGDTELGYKFIISDRLTIELSFEKIQYSISVKQVLTNNNLDDAQAITEPDLTNASYLPSTVTVGQPYAMGDTILTNIEDNDYRFMHFVIKNRVGQYEIYSPSTIALTSNFLTSYTNEENEIEIITVFAKRYAINVQVITGEGLGNGDFAIYVLGENGVKDALSNGSYVDENTNIIIETYADNHSKFHMFEGLNDDANILGTIANFRIKEELDIQLHFQLSYYILTSETVDNNFKELDLDNVRISDGADPKHQLDKVSVNTMIYGISLLDEIEGYQFEGWYINRNGELISVANIHNLQLDEMGNISAFVVTQDFIDMYANESNEVVFVARYFKLYLVTIESNDTSKGNFELYKINTIAGQEDEYELLVKHSSADYYAIPYGTRVVLVPILTNNQYYAFADYTGKTSTDIQLGNGDNSWLLNKDELQFTVNTERYITLNFVSVIKAYDKKVDTSDAKGTLKFSSDTFAVGDSVTITFEIESGYEVREWIIIDKSGVQHNVGSLDNINYSGTNTLTITIDEYWLDNFGYQLDTKVITMMNSTFFTVVIIGVIAIPILLAGVIIFIILNNKKKEQAAAAAKHSAANKFGLDQQKFLKSLVDEDNGSNSNNDKKGKQ